MLLTGSQIVIEVLAEQKADTVFGYPGGNVLQIFNQLYKNRSRIKHILTAHEQGASHAADGYARAGGRVGVVIATSGPGATNLITGLATALADSSPVVAITGSVSQALSGTDSFQEIDAMSLTVAVTKRSFFVRRVDELADILRKAFKTAKEGRPGPVLVDIPQDVQMALCSFRSMERITPDEIPKAEDTVLDECVKMINNSQKPIIYCGGGVINGECANEVKGLLEKTDGYLASTMMGLGAVESDNPKNLGMAGMYGRMVAVKAISKADLVIAVGARFSDRGTGNSEKFAPEAQIIHLDIDASEDGKTIKTDLHVNGNVKSSLEYITEKIMQKKLPKWKEEVEKYKEIYPEKSRNSFSPKEIIETAGNLLPAKAVIATDVGQHQMWTAKYFPLKSPRTFITSGGFGTMGFGMGAAIGASLATKRMSVLFTGDGSFLMNMNEITTAVRYGLNIIIVLFNNSGLGMIRQLQKYFCEGNYFSIDLNGATDYIQLAKSLGAKGYRAANINDFKVSMERAVSLGGVTVIECIIPREESALPMIPPGGGIDNTIS